VSPAQLLLANTFHKKVGAHVPEPLRPALEPLLKTIASMTESIQEYDRQLEVLWRSTPTQRRNF
jgi:hypothetical protein